MTIEFIELDRPRLPAPATLVAPPGVVSGARRHSRRAWTNVSVSQSWYSSGVQPRLVTRLS